MPRYAIAVVSPKSKILQKVVEGEGQEDALKRFFSQQMSNRYTDDDQGYFYFKEDFFDPQEPLGSILEV